MNENFGEHDRHRFSDRLNGDVQRSADEVSDWINGSGGMVLGLAVIALAIWFVAGLVVG
ncbi:hypothetical protein [Nocardioides pakistanensis]